MFLKQYYLGCLAHASYMIADEKTKTAVVVDPQRDIEQYLADAKTGGYTIKYVFLTHFHADFLAGHIELRNQAGARICMGQRAGAEFEHTALKEGDIIEFGDVRIQTMETPGHTPEGISLLVFDLAASDIVPNAVLTGDTLFIGDVGRPDLLASIGVTADELAEMLYHSIDKLRRLPDSTLVYPAHGAGSSCGKNLSSETVCTIGKQKRTNYALAPMTEEEFVKVVTEGQNAAPLYFPFAAVTNRKMREVFDEAGEIQWMSIDEVLQAQKDGAVVIDTREPMDFATGHLLGSINVGLSGRFAEYTGEVVTSSAPLVLLCPDGTEAEARVRLARIGFDKVIGALRTPEKVFMDRPELVGRASRLTVDQLKTSRSDVKGLQVVDVRGPGEVSAGMVPGAKHVQLPSLINDYTTLDPQAPTVVYCAGGYRSSIAASFLRQRGFVDVSDLLGGFGAWSQAGEEVAVVASTH